MRKIIVGVMGPGGEATESDRQTAFELGKLIAQQNWVLLTGGKAVGVMDAACRGAKQEGGITVGILPTESCSDASEAIDIAIATGMGSARNNINILSSDIVIACGMGTGTASEVALALKANKKVILLNQDQDSQTFFKNLLKSNVFIASSSKEAIKLAKKNLATKDFS